MTHTDAAAATGLPEKIPLNHPADKAIKDAIRMMDDAYRLMQTARLAILKFEDEGGSDIKRTLEIAADKIEEAETELRHSLADPYRMGGER